MWEHAASALKMNAVCSFEILVSIRQNARCHNAKDYSMKLLVLSCGNVLVVKYSRNREVLSWVDRDTGNQFSY